MQFDEKITFWIPGVPKPGGSKRALTNRKTGFAYVIDASKYTKIWKKAVATMARTNYFGELLEGPIRLDISFYMPRPKLHFRSGKYAGELKKKNIPYWHISKPDTTKLLRSTEDALTGIVWKDDRQVCVTSAEKIYSSESGARITIRRLEEREPIT